MKKLIILLILPTLLLSGCSFKLFSSAKADESPFVVESLEIKSRRASIPAILTKPHIKKNEYVPLVVMAHSYNGDKDQLGAFTTLANELALNGIASIRMDFAGCGDSTEDFSENNITNMLSDVRACLRHVQKLNIIDEHRIGILGYSIGGRVATMAIQSKYYSALALWAPAADNGRESIYSFVGGERNYLNLLTEAEIIGSAEYTTPEGETIRLGLDFFKDIKEDKPLSYLQRFRGPVFIAFAEDDSIVSKETIDIVTTSARKSSEVTVKMIEDADHSFGLLTDSPNITKQLTDSTMQFFMNTFNIKKTE